MATTAPLKTQVKAALGRPCGRERKKGQKEEEMGARKRATRFTFGALAIVMAVLWYLSGDFEFHLSLVTEQYSVKLGVGALSIVALLASLTAVFAPGLISRHVDLEPFVISDSKSKLRKYGSVVVTMFTCFPAFFLSMTVLCLVIESFATGKIVTTLDRSSFEARDVVYQVIGLLSLPGFFLWVTLSRHDSKPLIGDVVCDIYLRRVKDDTTFGATVAREIRASFFFLATALTLPVSLLSKRQFPIYDKEQICESMRWKES